MSATEDLSQMTRSSPKPLVVVPCGGRKQPAGWRGPAHDLYTGPYFRGCLRAALALTPGDRVRILSGKYGLLRLTDEVEPYEQRIDEAGHVTLARLHQQLDEQGLRHAPHVIALVGSAYAKQVVALWGHAATSFPLAGVGGIGKQLARLKEIARDGRL